MGKDTISHCSNYNHNKNLQQSRNFRWMGFLQQFHLVIRYKKVIYNKVADMLSRPIVNSAIILKHNSIIHESYIEQYVNDSYFKMCMRT